MIEIRVYNTGNSFRVLGGATGNRTAVPVGMARMPLSQKQFADCRAELEKLARKGILMFEAGDEQGNQAVSFGQVCAFFERPQPKRETLPVVRDTARVVAPVQVEPPAPAPAPWMPKEQSPGLAPSEPPLTAPDPDWTEDTE